MDMTMLDLIIILIYLGVLFVLGTLSYQKRSSESFLISERRLSLLRSISTINASKTGAIIVAYTALVYQFGISAFWLFLGTISGYLLFIPFAVKLYRQGNSKQYSLPEYFFKYYGDYIGYLAMFLGASIMLGFLIINLTAAAQTLTTFTQFSFESTTLLIIFAVFLYLILGGFNAVTHTDTMQYLLMLMILTVLPIYLYLEGMNLTVLGTGILTAGITNIIAFFILGMLFPFALPDLWQRVYALPSLRLVKLSILFSSLIYFLFGIVLTLFALQIKSQLPEIRPDIAFVQGLDLLLPPGLFGLGLVLLFSAFMSSIDSYLYTAASTLTHNLFSKNPKKTLVRRTRWFCLGVALLATALTLLISNVINSVYITALAVTLALPTLLSWIFPSISKIILISGMAIGALTVLWSLPTLFEGETIDPSIIMKALLGTIVGVIVGVSVVVGRKLINKQFSNP